VVALSSAQKGQHRVVYDVADRRGKASSYEGDLTFFPEGRLHRRGELAKLADLVPMNLIEGYEQPGAILSPDFGGSAFRSRLRNAVTWASCG
jgi:hypothetical protein